MLHALIELKKEGMFAAALIKKQRYWPALVPGDYIVAYFKDKSVGPIDEISRILDGIKYNIWCIKELEYCMSIMATGGVFCSAEGKEIKRFWKENGTQKTTTFKYAKPFEYHFWYRHAMDGHNNLGHAMLSLEGIW